jgi:cytochrome c
LLKPIFLFSAAVLFAVSAIPASTIALAAAPQPPAAQDSTNPAKPTGASQEHAKSLYARDCALCHGEDGSGKTDLAKDMKLTLLDWTDPKSLANRSDKELFHAIRVGKDSMPAEEEGRAKDPEVWNLIIYIRGFAKGQAAPAPVAAPAPAAAPVEAPAAAPAAAPAPAPAADPSKPGN